MNDTLRRIAPRAGWNGNMIAPPPIIAFECEYLIDAVVGDSSV